MCTDFFLVSKFGMYKYVEEKLHDSYFSQTHMVPLSL